MHSNSTVSIAICNFNYAHFITAAVDSALSQTSKALEVLVVDDGSTDESREILARYGTKIRTIFQENAGQRAAYNALFAAVRGTFVIFLDSDDTLHESAVSVVLECMADSDLAKLHWRLELIDTRGKKLGVRIPHFLDRGDFRERIERGRLYASAPGSGNAYRVAALQTLFPLPTSAQDRHAADFFTIYGSAVKGRIGHTDQILGCYRIHQTNEPGTSLQFGNAADKQVQSQMRWDELRSWLYDRTGGEVCLAAQARSFSHEKLVFARRLLSAGTYLSRVTTGWYAMGSLMDSARENGMRFRVAVFIWALLVSVVPLSLAKRLSAYVCNPASRVRA